VRQYKHSSHMYGVHVRWMFTLSYMYAVHLFGVHVRRTCALV